MPRLIYILTVVFFLSFFGYAYNDFMYGMGIPKYTIFSSVIALGIIFNIIWIEYFFKNVIHFYQKYLFNILFFLGIFIVLTIPLFYKEGLNNWGAPINIYLIKSISNNLENVKNILRGTQFFQLLIPTIIVCALIYIPVQKFRKYFMKKNISAWKFLTLTTVYLFTFGILFNNNFLLNDDRKDNIQENEIFSSFFSKSPERNQVKRMQWKQLEALETINPVKDFKKRNVILISVDCLRPDILGFNNPKHKLVTPFLDSLSQSEHFYQVKHAFSTCNNSFGGILSMLFAQDQSNLSNVKIGVHSVLDQHGYDVNFILSGNHEDFYGLKHHYGNDIDTYLEGSEFSDLSDANDLVILENLNSIQAAKRNGSFFFFHLMSPHIFGEVTDHFRVNQPDLNSYSVDLDRDTDPTLENIVRWKNNYTNGIQQSDYIIKEIFKILEKKNYLDDALIIITGDHGESLGEYDLKLGHGVALREHYTTIPILIYDTDIKNQEDILFGSQIDIPPLILDKLSIPAPRMWDGINLSSSPDYRLLYQEQFDYANKSQSYGLVIQDSISVSQFVVNQKIDTSLYILSDSSTSHYPSPILTDSLRDIYLDILKSKIQISNSQ